MPNDLTTGLKRESECGAAVVDTGVVARRWGEGCVAALLGQQLRRVGHLVKSDARAGGVVGRNGEAAAVVSAEWRRHCINRRRRPCSLVPRRAARSHSCSARTPCSGGASCVSRFLGSAPSFQSSILPSPLVPCVSSFRRRW